MTTRNEEILKAAHELEYPENVPYFVNGAEWADKHPSKEFLRLQNRWKPSEEMLKALYRVIPENTMIISEDEMLLDKLYQGLKYDRVLSNK